MFSFIPHVQETRTKKSRKHLLMQYLAAFLFLYYSVKWLNTKQFIPQCDVLSLSLKIPVLFLGDTFSKSILFVMKHTCNRLVYDI